MVALSASCKTMAAQLPLADIGAVSELRGTARIFRDEPINALLKTGIQPLDDIRTAQGRVAVTFLDDSIVRLTENSNLVIDEYVYDPDPSKSKLAINFAQGTARFVTGKLGRIDKKNIRLTTPSADIAIRGTSFSVTVNELGSSLIMLLPDAITGLSSGEIIVTTAMGQVALNKPFEATTVDVFLSNPTPPVILDLSLELIDNMLIVNPPKEVTNDQSLEEGVRTTADYLAFDDLNIDYLNEDLLDNESDLEFTELDINYLDTNFLEDLLNILDTLNDMQEEDQLSQLASSVNVKGTIIGQDRETQITTIVDATTISLRRSVNDSYRLDVNSGGSYTLILIQDGISRTITINGGGESVIKIRQGS